jgi:hypothetical protein
LPSAHIILIEIKALNMVEKVARLQKPHAASTDYIQKTQRVLAFLRHGDPIGSMGMGREKRGPQGNIGKAPKSFAPRDCALGFIIRCSQ